MLIESKSIARAYLIILLCTASTVEGAKFELLELGARAGFSTETIHGEDFSQWEIIAASRLPWVWEWASGWSLDTRLNGSIGALQGDGETAAVLTLGPGLALTNPGKRFAVEVGVSPTLLSEDKFDRADFGGNFQFTSFIGVSYLTSERIVVAARFQHMSNAGIDGENTGLNQMAVTISYRL